MEELRDAKGRLLGVDFGDRRTGLAVSDAERRIASAIGRITAGGIESAAAAVARTARERAVSGVVVGLPIRLDGTRGPRAERTEKFARLLRKALAEEGLGIPVALMDERLTTLAASRYLDETGAHGGRRRDVIDALSAEIILQDALDWLRIAAGRDEAEEERTGHGS